uniref:WBP2 N-terminal like n=1 Tax=Labrus bergylta TaxID=56723 RepID=A0A3Q3EVB7_9LABR
MALNRNHSQNGGVLINNGESVVRDCKNVELSFSDVSCKTDLLKGTKKGTVYLTPYRMVFVSSNIKDCMGSAMFPYYLMKGCSIEQPVFAANFIKGTVSAEPGGGWEGQAHFKMSFPSGGAIELGQHLFKLATNASRAPPAQNGASSFGYPSPGMMNGYGPPSQAPPAYPFPPPPPQQNGFYQGPPPAPTNMGYPSPTPAAGNVQMFEVLTVVCQILLKEATEKESDAAGGSMHTNPSRSSIQTVDDSFTFTLG